MRRPLLEEDPDDPSEQGSTGMANPLDGLDMTDPWSGAPATEEEVIDPGAGTGEWGADQLVEGEGEWDPNQQYPGAQPQYADEPQYPEAEAQQWEEQYAAAPPPRRPAPRPAIVDPALTETEKRFQKYGFYRLLVTNRFFDNDDPISNEVETELNAFIRGRMANLLGGDGGVEAPVGFTPEEASALKAVASSMLASKQPRRQAPPQQRPRQQPPQAQPARRPPVAAAPRPHVRPQMAPRPQRPAAPPQLRRPQQPLRPPQLARRQQPQPPQQRPQPPQQPPQQQRQQQNRPQQPQQPQRPGKPQPRVLGRGELPGDESIVEENGRKVKIMYREAFPGEYGPKLEAVMRRIPVGMHTRLSNGVQILRGGPEEWIKVVRRDLTIQTNDRTRMPFPRNMQMATAELAGSSLETIRLAPGMERVITRGLSS